MDEKVLKLAWERQWNELTTEELAELFFDLRERMGFMEELFEELKRVVKARILETGEVPVWSEWELQLRVRVDYNWPPEVMEMLDSLANLQEDIKRAKEHAKKMQLATMKDTSEYVTFIKSKR